VLLRSVDLHRFFINNEDIRDGHIVLKDENAAHGHVLRLRTGEQIVAAISGDDMDYFGIVRKISKGEIWAEIADTADNTAEIPLKVTLFQALPKGGKMGDIIENVVELGIYEIMPFISERSVTNRVNSDKIARWQKIAESAAKLSHRGRIPQIGGILSFKEAVATAKTFDAAFACYEFEKSLHLADCLADFLGKLPIKGHLAFFIGPEGGFSGHEIEFFKQSSIPTVSLGPRILRTQSAAAVVMAIINYQLSIINGENHDLFG
jgi:16S rRNA (uracil1498-N3)-methyltransferase